MRNRLDEIVEEVYRDYPMDVCKPRQLARAAAERAFRHGVEQCVGTTFNIRGHVFDFDGKGWLDAVGMGVAAARKQMENVQPAPAGEKPKYWCCEKHGFPSGPIPIGEPCALCNHTGYFDRRKGGERRKGHEYRNGNSIIAEFLNFDGRSCPHTYLIDRRSGRDRRKP